MTTETIPGYSFPMLYALGVLLLALGIPLMRRRVKPNWIYGVRFPSTMADESVWYDMNARGGRDLVVISVLYLVILTIAWLFGAGWSSAARFLIPVGFLAVALVGSTIYLAIASSRMLRERRGSQ